MPDFDSPWKEALDKFFQPFIALFFPVMFADIDWQQGYETLDKELQQITPDAEQGRRVVDKLVKVWRLDGTEEWVLIHVEVQGEEESQFAWRMFVYNSRLVERYNRSVVSVAVLADENPRWRPQGYRRQLWGCSTEFRFPSVKLLDYLLQSDELEASDNPFAPFMLAYLKAREFRQDEQFRYNWKLRLVRGLYERGWGARRVRELFRLIDWVIALPDELAAHFRDELAKVELEKQMPYVTSIERLAQEEGWKKGREEGREEGLERGREAGLRQGIAAVLEVRFGESGLSLMPEIEALGNAALLQTILDQARTVPSPEELRRCWQ